AAAAGAYVHRGFVEIVGMALHDFDDIIAKIGGRLPHHFQGVGTGKFDFRWLLFNHGIHCHLASTQPACEKFLRNAWYQDHTCSYTGPMLPLPTGLPSSCVTATISRVELLIQISLAPAICAAGNASSRKGRPCCC